MIGNTFYFDWEINLITVIQEHFGKLGILLSQFCSLLGQEYPLVLMVMIFFFCIDKKLGERLGISLMTVLIWAPMVKNIFLRRRPYFDHENVKILIAPSPTEDAYDLMAQGFSLPSAHSACSATAYPQLAYAIKKKWAVVLIGIGLPLIIGISRFCVGAHYPTDVLCGWALGIVSTIAVVLLKSKINNPDISNFILLITGIPGLFYCQSEDFFTGFGLLLGSCFGFMFERKFVDFKPTKKLIYNILRIALGICVFLAFAQGIKFIFGDTLLIRVIRYAIGAFMTLGIFPLIFTRYEKEKE